MFPQERLQPPQPYDFDKLARKEPDGRRRLCLTAMAHLWFGYTGWRDMRAEN